MADNSYDYQDTQFHSEAERQYFDDVEFIRDRQTMEQEKYQRDRPRTNYRTEGIDAPDEVPLWWIEFRGRQALVETFSDGDGDPLGMDEEIINPNFQFFRTDIRNNHWF